MFEINSGGVEVYGDIELLEAELQLSEHLCVKISSLTRQESERKAAVEINLAIVNPSNAGFEPPHSFHYFVHHSELFDSGVLCVARKQNFQYSWVINKTLGDFPG